MLTALICCGALLLALAVDRWLGEPAARLHSVVWMGNYLNGLLVNYGQNHLLPFGYNCLLRKTRCTMRGNRSKA